MKLDQEARVTIQCLAQRGQSLRAISRLLGVTEGAVRYHLRRQAEGARDGRAAQPLFAANFSDQIAHYLESLDGGPVNLTALHEWLIAEHDYPGSLRSVQRFYARQYPRPKQRWPGRAR